ncbi:hypothetical protein [Bacillus thuringiensis]|uniref:hypothetical protein n=1 Tax=Bacillus thuringiensis TaxID=1428 RepID=UPI000EA0BB83|nr:hypothetical protein [Bacillus thuringiensis]RKI20302.1 hypothetical protein D7V71_28020 [Bacillus thuringiensis]
MFTNNDFDINELTNIKLDTTSNISSKFLMRGVKMFDETRHYLLKNNKLGKYALPSSALATYIYLHFYVNDVGLLPRDFKLSIISNASGIAYTTVHTGFQALLESGMIREVFINGISIYEICNYARLNRTYKETTKQDIGKLSYFRIPNHLLDSKVLKQLVSHRDSKGILLLLDLCNTFTRKIGLENKNQIEKFITQRTMSYLKEKLGRNAKKVREYLKIIRPIFPFTASNTEVRKPNMGRLTRIKEYVEQIFIKKFNVHISAECVIESQNKVLRQQEAHMRKEAKDRLKSLKLALSMKEGNDLIVAFKNEISTIAQFLKHTKDIKRFMTYTMTYALDELENFLKSGNKVSVLGAFMRAKFRESILSWRTKYIPDDSYSDMRHDLVLALTTNNIPVPDALKA